MSSAQALVDSRTAQRLRLRRVLVVDSRRDRAEAFAQRLQSAGASAVAVSADQGPHAAAHALDADVMLVNEDEPVAVRPLVIALRRHPRARWATVLPSSFAALWPPGAQQPDIAAMAEELSRLAETLMELSVRARGKLPYETALEPLGPNRILRVLDNTSRKLRVVLSNDQLVAELELGDHRVSRVRAAFGDVARALVDVEALAAILSMSSGHVRIAEGSSAKGPVSWNATLSAGLEAAAALACARMMPEEEPAAPAASGVRLAVNEQTVALERVLESQAREPNATVPAIDLAEVLADSDDAISANIHVDVADEAEPAAVPDERPSAHPTVQVAAAPSVAAPSLAGEAEWLATTRRGGARAALTFALLALAGGAVAFALSGAALPWQHAARTNAAQPAPASVVAPTSTSAHLATAVPAAEAQMPAIAATAAPAAEAAPPLPAAEPPATRAPTARELKEARSITTRGHRYLRADRPETAAKAYLNALALAPEHTPAIAPLIRIYLDYANAPEAVRWAESLVALQPNDGNAYLLLGDAYELSGDGTLAEQAWQRAATLGNAQARKRLR